jgi:hypothetical protein
MAMTKKQQVTYSIITGTALLLILLVIALVIDCPTQSQSKIFNVILALSAASYGASIPGILNINYRGTVTAGGALAIFVIVFSWKPAELKDLKSCDDTFQYIIYLQDSKGNSMPSTNTELSAYLDNEAKPWVFLESGEAQLRNVPIKYINKHVDIGLKSTNWVFSNGSQRTRIKLSADTTKFILVRLKDSCTKIMGSIPVTSQNFQSIQIRLVGSDNVTSTPDTNGHFTLLIPEGLQNETKQVLKITKGNKSYEFEVYPCQKNEITLPE